MSKVAIIDPVGVKAGMNYYDIGLLSGLHNHGLEVYLFSNTDDVPSKIKNYPSVNNVDIFALHFGVN